MSMATARTFCRCSSGKRPKYSPSVSALRSSPIHSTFPSPKSHTTVRYESCPLRHAFSSSPITSGISFPFRAKPRRTARCSIIHASSRLIRRSRRAPATPSSRSTSMAKHSNRMVNRPFGSAHDSRTCRTPCSVHEILGGRACSRVVYCIVSKCRHTRSSLWSYSGHGSPHSGHRHRSSPCSTHTCTCRCSSFSSTRSTRQGVLNPSNCRYSSVSRIRQVSSHHARGPSSSPTENPQEPEFRMIQNEELWWRFAHVVLLERVQRRRHLFHRRPLAIVRLDLRPAHAPLLIEHEHSRTGNAVEFLLRVLRIAQTVAIDRPRSGIRQQFVSQRTAPIGFDLLLQVAALFGPIAADRVEPHVGERLRKIAESDQLPDAVRSPEPAIKHQHDLMAARRRQPHDP